MMSPPQIENILVEKLNNINLSTPSSQPFIINNDLELDENYFITSVNLNFYQIWSIFNTLPRIYQTGKCKYEWRFQKMENEPVFCVYDWNNNRPLLQTKSWYIGSNTNDETKISEFLKILCDAIECYNLYYKCIEKHIFTSDDPIVDKRLKEIKSSIVKNRKVLKELT